MKTDDPQEARSRLPRSFGDRHRLVSHLSEIPESASSPEDAVEWKGLVAKKTDAR